MGTFASSVIALTENLKYQFDLVPIIGFEVEFYLRHEDAPYLPSDDAWESFTTALKKADVILDALKEEDGEGQFECCLSPLPPMLALEQLDTLKEIVNDWAEQQNAEASFAPRVEEDQPSSALHVHVHLEKDGCNVFTKEEETLSPPLAHAIAGLLALLPESMLCFAPDALSYKRYREWEKYTPSKVAWGNNNRTTPIRLPATEKPTSFRHIEHRVSAAHVDAERALAAILAGIYHGLKEPSSLPECMYGDARERNYPELPDLPKSLEQACLAYEQAARLSDYLQPEASEAIKSVTDAQSTSAT